VACRGGVEATVVHMLPPAAAAAAKTRERFVERGWQPCAPLASVTDAAPRPPSRLALRRFHW